ncbi:MAG: hypothetical protein ACFFD4_11595, partial [Candidatus Odinarchaeota archaeon]
MMKIVLQAFGDYGIEYIIGDEIEDLDHLSIVTTGNYYSSVLGLSAGNIELYGPLPVSDSPRYLCFLLQFPAKDSTIKDERIRRNQHITTAFWMIFSPTKDIDLLSKNRTVLNRVLKEKSKKYSVQELRKTTAADIAALKVDLVNKLEQVAVRQDQTDNLAVQVGKSIVLLEILSRTAKSKQDITFIID